MNNLPAISDLDRLCGRENWTIIGVSALVYDDAFVYLEIANPKYWKTSPDGRPIVTLACIGGHPKVGELPLDCLKREAIEEIGISLRII
ncbi:MAG: NUDIX hydrolase, partial [Anaerolineales bacterium]|nr:NUDIX hydrolase [Anaerolineales bacterium]